VTHGLLAFVANSLCTATAFQESHGIAPAVIRPLLPSSPAGDDGASASSRRKVVLFDPVLAGGIDIALGLAALRPDLQFDLVEDGVLDHADMARLICQRQWLGNVRLVRRPAERREIYRDAGLLLVPPRREIGWCRAVSEAQACGVPALAVRSGGLPEAVGAGGVIVPRTADLLRWRDGLAEALDDPERYRSLSEAARNAIRRPELAADRVADQWLDVFSRHLARIGYVM
jgi:glycosyltransferase involved in cell wall biosynthesis